MENDSRVVCMALTHHGRLLATASSKGKLVRLFNTLDGSLLQEVRRGADRADIYSLAFFTTAERLVVSSDRGTVHVFNLKVDFGPLQTISDHNNGSPPVVSHLSFVKGVLPSILVQSGSGSFERGFVVCCWFWSPKEHGCDTWDGWVFDPVAGGEMIVVECHNFLKQDETVS